MSPAGGGTGTGPGPGCGRTFKFPVNGHKLEAMRVEPAEAGTTLLVRIDGTERRIVCGRRDWTPGRATWGRLPEQPAAAGGGWAAAGTFTAKLCFVETPFVVTVRLTFAGSEVRVASEANVGFGPTREPPLVGTAEWGTLPVRYSPP